MPEVINADNWRQFAACRGVDPDIFFPGAGSGSHKALSYCARCPAACRHHCVIEGNKFHDPGIRGGLSANERSKIYGVPLGYHTDYQFLFRRPEPHERNVKLSEEDVPEKDRVKERHLTEKQVQWVIVLYDDGWSYERIAKLFSVNKATIWRAMNGRYGERSA